MVLFATKTICCKHWTCLDAVLCCCCTCSSLAVCERRKVTEYQRSCAFKVARQLQRRRQMQQTTAFLVWLRYCQHCRTMRAGMQQLVKRVEHERLSTAFSAWSHCVSAATGMPRCTCVCCSMIKSWSVSRNAQAHCESWYVVRMHCTLARCDRFRLSTRQ